jgi:hypothetical protein
MTLSHSISNTSLLSCLLNGLALVACSRKAELRRAFPALLVFLGVKFGSDVGLNFLLNAHHLWTPRERYTTYFGLYWLSFFIGSIAIFYLARQIFEYVTQPLSGLKKAGRVLFRWTAVISAIVVLATSLHPYGLSMRSLPLAMFELMRCMGLLELCLLAFLAFTVHPLGLSFKSQAFGIGLGMGLLAATDIFVATAAHLLTSWVAYFNLVGEVGTLLVFMIWCVYFFKREPERKSLMMPANSQLLRWNEIASAFGHRSGQVVLTPAPSTFFLQDVEKVVDRVMSRNSIDAG